MDNNSVYTNAYNIFFNNNGNKDLQQQNQALEQLQQQADQGDSQCIELLAQVAITYFVKLELAEKIKEYCQKVSDAETDETRKNKFLNYIKQINEKYAKIKSDDRFVKVAKWMCVVSSILTLAAFVFLFAGIHTELSVVPKMSKAFLVPTFKFWSWCYNYIDYAGMFGIQLFLVARILRGVFKKGTWTTLGKTFGWIVNFLIVAIVVLHFYLQYSAGLSMYANFMNYFTMLLVPALIAWLLALIIRKIAKIK